MDNSYKFFAYYPGSIVLIVMYIAEPKQFKGVKKFDSIRHSIICIKTEPLKSELHIRMIANDGIKSKQNFTIFF